MSRLAEFGAERLERIAARTTGLRLPAGAGKDFIRYSVWSVYRAGERIIRKRVPLPFLVGWFTQWAEDFLTELIGPEPSDLDAIAGDLEVVADDVLRWPAA